MVSRNLERANENDGFKMTALEITMILASAMIGITVKLSRNFVSNMQYHMTLKPYDKT